MLLREAKLIYYQGGTGQDRTNDREYLGNDNFFTVNYDERIKRETDVVRIMREIDKKNG